MGNKKVQVWPNLDLIRVAKKSTPPPRIKGRAKKRTGDQFWTRTGRARMDGRQCFGDFKGKTLGKSGKIPGKKKLDGRQKIGVGGRARMKYRPSFYTGGGGYDILMIF